MLSAPAPPSPWLTPPPPSAASYHHKKLIKSFATATVTSSPPCRKSHSLQSQVEETTSVVLGPVTTVSSVGTLFHQTQRLKQEGFTTTTMALFYTRILLLVIHMFVLQWLMLETLLVGE